MKKFCSLDKKYAKGGSFNLLEELINNDILDEENPLYDQAKESLKNNDTDAMLYVMDEMIQADMIDSSYPDYKAIKKAIKENSEKEFKAFLKDPNLKKEYAKYKKLPGATHTFNQYAKELFEYDKHADGGKIKLFVGGGHEELDNPYHDERDSEEEEVIEEVVEETQSIKERAQGILDRLKENGLTTRLVTYQGKRVIETIKLNADKSTYSWYYSVPGSKASAILQNGHLSELDVFDIYSQSLVELGYAKGGLIKDNQGNYKNSAGYELIDQFDGTYQVLDPEGMDISGEYETLKQGKQTIKDYMESMESYAQGGKIYTDKREDGYNAKYWVGKNESGQWTVFSESDKWKKRDEFVGGLASEKDATYMAKLSAGVINEADPEEAFMRNEFSGGGKVPYIAYYDDYEKSVGYVIEKLSNDDILYWSGKEWSLKAYANTYKTKAEAKKVLKSISSYSDGGIMDSRISLLKKMDAKNPSATLKARIKLLEKMGKKAEPKETQAQELAEQIIASAGTPSSKIGTNDDHTIRMTWPEYNLEITIDDESSPIAPGILIQYKTVNREYTLKKIKDAINDINVLKKPKEIKYYSLNEHDEGGDPEFVENLATVEDNGMLDNKDFIQSLENAIREAREFTPDEKFSFDEVWWDDIKAGKEFSTEDENEDTRIWYLTPKVESKPKPKPEPEPKPDTNWKSIFANPERFQNYGGEFLYPPRAENKVRPNAMMFGKLDNNTFIAEPKMNGSATSVTIFENTFVVKERHNSFFATPPDFNFQALHRGKGAMCIVGEFMNKSKKDEDGKAFRGFCIWDITAYEDQILIGSTIEERLKLLDKLYPTKGVIQTKAGNDLLFITEVPDIYKVATFDKSFEKLFNELTKIDMIEGFVLKRKNARLEMMTSETNNSGSFIKMRKPTANYEF